MGATPPKASFPSTADAKGLLAKLREFALVGAGLMPNNRLDGFVRLRDLVDGGVVVPSKGFIATGGGNPVGGVGQAVKNASPPYVKDLTPPPSPGSFAVSVGVSSVMFETAPPTYLEGHGPARTLIYAAPYSGSGPLPTFADAVKFHDYFGDIGTTGIDPAANMRFWATWMSVDGVESPPAGGTNGVAGVAGLVGTVNLAPLAVTAAKLAASAVSEDKLQPAIIGEAHIKTAAVGSAAIQNLAVTNGKIANLAVDDAKIASVTVGKLRAGSITAGEYIQSANYVAGLSGWRLSTLAGGAGFFEVRGNGVFGGTIYADAGQIGGMTIGTNYLMSNNYVLGTSGFALYDDGRFLSKQFSIDVYGNAYFTGDLNARGAINGGGFTGYSWPASGQTGYHLSSQGLLLGNFNDGQWFQVTASGQVTAPGLQITGGSATFSGNLNAASGTFVGSVGANSIHTNNLVGAAVTSTYSASGGSVGSVNVVVPSGVGVESLVIISEAGGSMTGGSEAFEGGNYNDFGETRINGTTVLSGCGTMIGVMANPAVGTHTVACHRTYQYGASSTRNPTIVVLMCKR